MTFSTSKRGALQVSLAAGKAFWLSRVDGQGSGIKGRRILDECRQDACPGQRKGGAISLLELIDQDKRE